MNHIDKIGRRYTEVVAEWIAKGYIIDLAFARSGGEISKLDMTNGAEFVQIMVDRFEEWETNLTGVEIVVSKRADVNSPFKTAYVERFYRVGESRRTGVYFGSAEEATAATIIRRKRALARDCDIEEKDMTAQAMDIAKRIIRRKFGVTRRITEAYVKVTRYANRYFVIYRDRTYRLK
jgi:hypothetical protein